MAVIVILAIIALIATPIILNVIEGSKRSSVLRSGELYLKGIEQVIAGENLKNEFNPSSCEIQSDGNLICDSVELEIKASGEKPREGTLTLKDGKVTNVEGMVLGDYLLGTDSKGKLVIQGTSDSKDTTPPEIKINVNTITTNSIKVTVEATDEESEITGYYYSLNNEDSYNQGQNIQEFSNLKAGTSYTIYVKVVNEKELEATDNVTETTLTIDMPKVEIDKSDWAYSKEVTITYPEVEGQDLIYSYLKEGEDWITTQEVVTKVIFESAGTIVAKVTDGTEQNTLTTMSYTVDKIDRLAPSITGVTVKDTETGGRITVEANDDESGIDKYSFDNGSNWQDENYIDVTESKTYYIQVKDKVGNVSKTTQDAKLLYREKILNGAYPELYDGLTPVRYDGTNWVVANQREEWYNYAKQEWANAVILKSGVTKSAGQTVNVSSDITAMFVWIPRYEYKYTNLGTNYAGGTKSQPGEIEVNFISSSQTSPSSSDYHVHPAFTFGSEKLNGIWVGKFETSHTTLSSSTSQNNLSCTDNNCKNADGLRILPNVKSIVYNNVSNFFYAGLSMTRSGNPFGLNRTTTDSHMMKNSEWGAVAYLSQSKYGKYGNASFDSTQKEVYINNSSNYYTGRSGGSSDASSSSDGTYLYNENINGTGASTTGNIYGVYDMSGGAWEYVMGYYTPAYGSGSSKPWGAASDKDYAGFKSEPAKKYYDAYTTTSATTACSDGVCYGHALSETSSWYGDYSSFVSSFSPWFIRGGGYNDGSNAGVFFFYDSVGIYNSYSFRVVLSSTTGA